MRRRISPILAILSCALAAGVGVGVLSTLAGNSTGSASCSYADGLGSFSSSNHPSACWRPYGDSSPFNQQVLPGTPLVSNSASLVTHLLAGGSVDYLVFGDPARDGGVPIYWSSPSDPLYTLHCVKPWGRCALEGLVIHVPATAVPAGGYATPSNDHDAHMTVIDQASGWEYDLWNVNSKSGSTINFGWGGKTRINGNGLGSGAVAAGYGSIAGPIRFAELQGGLINHALTMVVPCSNSYVYPANGAGLSCSAAGLPSSSSIPIGSHFQLNMTPAQIAALNVPSWKKTILTALASYGAYVSDTTGVADQWGFETESAASYTSFGQPDPWVQYAKSLGIQPQDFNHNGYQEYWMDLASGVPWDRMQVLNVCAARGTCFPPVPPGRSRATIGSVPPTSGL